MNIRPEIVITLDHTEYANLVIHDVVDKEDEVGVLCVV